MEKIFKLEKKDPSGLSLKSIIFFAFPEFISLTALVFLPIVIDLYFIACLKSQSCYHALGLSGNILNFLGKISEATMVSTMVSIGKINGQGKEKSVGNYLINSILASLFFATGQLILIVGFSKFYLNWMGASQTELSQAYDFLILQSLSLFFCFIFMSVLGFFRGIKNPKVPMIFNIFGIIIFLAFDYIFIFGKFGFSPMGLKGSALASVARYFSIAVLSVGYILSSKEIMNKYFSGARLSFDLKIILKIISQSVPIMTDKAILACSYVWLYKMIIPTKPHALAAIETVKTLERFAFIPALAFAQVTTFIISNNLGEKNFYAAKENIKKALYISFFSVSSVLLFICTISNFIIPLFDQNQNFTAFAVKALCVVSPLVLFDLFQVIMAAACRGLGLLKTVMLARFFSFSFFFFPASWLILKSQSFSSNAKFCLIYGSFYLTTGIVGLILAAKISKYLSLKLVKIEPSKKLEVKVEKKRKRPSKNTLSLDL